MRFDNLNSWLLWLESLKITRNAHVAKQQVTEVARRLKLLPFPNKVITVGGTNGKGSCVALLESIYSNAGYKVGAFTSPHLLNFNERIKIQQKPVATQKILAAFDLIDQARGDIDLVYFQFAFLAALLIFKDIHLDLVILEVGIGGEYDATNIVDADLAIISSVALDHCEILGNTREQIAADKAGIMRSNKPIICGDFNPPKAIFSSAKKNHAKLFVQGKDFYFETTDHYWNWFSEIKCLENLPMPANILLQNASTVLMAITNFNNIIPVMDQNIVQGLSDAKILGRQQLIMLDGKKVLLDVAHNPQAAELLYTKLCSLNIRGKKYAIVGFMQEKDIKGTVIKFIDDIDYWFVIELPNLRGAKIKQLSAALSEVKAKNIQVCAKPLDALQEALQQAEIGDIIVIFGSFLLIAEILNQEGV